MKTDPRAFLCVVLSVSLAWSGCTTFSTRTRPCAEGTSEAKVAVYWRNVDGERYHVEGMDIQIWPRSGGEARALFATSSAEGPVYFTNMPPGRYWLRVSKDGKERLKREIRLKPGRQTSARVNVTGRRLGANAAEAAEAIVVFVVAVAFWVAIAYLDAEFDDEPCRSRDDAPFIEINFK